MSFATPTGGESTEPDPAVTPIETGIEPTDTESVDAVAEPSAPPTGVEPVDMESSYLARRDQREDAERSRRFLAEYNAIMAEDAASEEAAEPEAPTPEEPTNVLSRGVETNQALADQVKAQSEGVKVAGAVVGDIKTGAIEGTRQAFGGAIDALNNAIELLNEMPVAPPPGLAPKTRGSAIKRLIGKVSPTPEAKSVTGAGIRVISQFAAGWYAGGKLLAPIKAFREAASLVKAPFQGALVDFTVFGPHEDRLANMIQGNESNPEFVQAIADFMAANEDDSAAEGRLKNAFEGLVVGVAFDGVLQGLRVLRSARRAKSAADNLKLTPEQRAAGDLEPIVVEADPERIRRLLGEPIDDSDELADELAEALEGESEQVTNLRDRVVRLRGEVAQVEALRDSGDSSIDIDDLTAVSDEIEQELAGDFATEEAIRHAHFDLLEKLDVATAELDTAMSREIRFGPSTEQLGEPGFSDIDQATGKQFLNFNGFDTQDDIKAFIRDSVDVDSAAIEKGRRGVVTFAETKASAAQIDAFDVLEKRRASGGFPNDAEQLAVRNLWLASGAKLKDLMRRTANEPSMENVFAFRRMMATHNMIQREAMGIRTETARALSAWRIPAGEGKEFATQMDAIIKEFGGVEVAQNLAEKLAKLNAAGNEMAIMNLVQVAPWAKTQKAMGQFWYFALLSGPKTHMRNIMSNVSVAGQSLYERKAAEIISNFTGSDAVSAGEAAAMFTADVEMMKEALIIGGRAARLFPKAAKTLLTEGPLAVGRGIREFGEREAPSFTSALQTGQSGHGMGKLDVDIAGGFSSEFWQLDPDSATGRIMDYMDTALSIPTNALAAEDELAKNITYRRELHAQANRKARREIESGELPADQLNARRAEIVADPDETIKLIARDEAQYRTMTSAPDESLNAVAKAFQDKLTITRWNLPLGRLIIPFRRTPINLFMYGMERTPFAPLSAQFAADMAAGGARKDMALAKMLTGSALMSVFADLAMSGAITGDGPSNMGQRANMRRQNIEPWSVRVPTGVDENGEDTFRYFSYRGLEPIASSMGLAANMVELLQTTRWEDDDEEMQEMLIGVSLAFAHQMTSQTYMQGVSNLLDAMSDPRRSGEFFFKQTAGSFIPAVVAEGARFADPYMRASHDMITAMQARTPQLSKGLPIKHDLWGRDKDRRSGLGAWYDVTSPVYSRAYNPEPIDKELEELGLWIGDPSVRMSFPAPGGSVTVNLKNKPEMYERYMELQGNELTHDTFGFPIDPVMQRGQMDTLNALVTGKHPQSSIYKLYGGAGPDSGKAKMINDFKSKFRNAAKEQLVIEFPELKAEINRRAEKANPGGNANFTFGQ